jgi:serine/threonine protein kinase
MNADDKAISIAARIADGSAIDWVDAGATPADADPAMLDELRAIAALATLHRTPSEWQPDASAPPITRWGPLTLLGPIGEGLFGRVYRAWDPRLHRQVALKLLHAPASDAVASPIHAIEEARLLARVRHPNVLTVYGAETVDGQVGIWTEFIDGHTLDRVLADRGPLPPDEVVAIGIDLCRALSAVHAAGLLHRDIKAQNVMRETGGRIVLMDFGTGHDLEAVPSRSGDLSGTPLYLAPEIFAGGAATVASDMYALAVLLHRLLTGRYPVEGRTLDEVRAGHAAGLRPTAVKTEPRAVVDAITRGLAVDPRHRYASADAFAAALLALQARSTTLDAQPPARPLVMVAVAAIAVAALSMVVTSDVSRNASQRRGDGNGAAAGATPLGVTAAATYHPLTPPESDNFGRPSRDGRYQPYMDPDSNLWYWELATGATHQVTAVSPNSGDSGGHSAMSPNGDRIAYSWYTKGKGYDLRVVEVATGKTTVLVAHGVVASHSPLEWSASGSQILCWLEHADGRVDMALVPVDGSELRVLKSFRQGHQRQASLSPDGRFVVYDVLRDFRSMQSQLMMLDTRQPAQPRVLIDERANNLSPFWTPDGRGVFFTSNRAGAVEGWVVPVSHGVAQGPPVLVASQLAGAMPLALTADGAYHYLLDTSDFDVHAVSVDFRPGASPAVGTPARISPAVVGGRVGPGWSPDGRRLAFITRVPSSSLQISLNRGANRITILDVGSGQYRDVVPQLSALNLAAPRWSPSGRAVAVRGISLDNQIGYFEVDVTNGETVPILLESASNESGYGAYQWSSDGRALIYRHFPRGIVSRDIESGKETILIDWRANGFNGFLYGFSVSPDGATIAFGAATGRAPNLQRSVYVQTAGGAPRALFTVRPPEVVVVQGWTPGGDVLFTRYTGGEDATVIPHQLWRVSMAGNDASDTTVRIPNFTQPYFAALSPDGRRLAYTLGQTRAEHWVMRGFLPPS